MSSSSASAAVDKFQKAHILIHDVNGDIQYNDPVEVLFNPQQYSIDKTNQFANMPIPGRQSPIIQFVRGESETLSIELFFDTYTYHSSQDVRDYTNRIVNLLKIDGKLHAPPICSFVWGKGGKEKPYFTGIIEKATTTYTMFLHDGTPVRAKMNLSLRQYGKQLEEEGIRPASPSKSKRRIIINGDSLWLIAFKEYGDPNKWRVIASANNIDNPLSLEDGIEIMVPPLE